MFAIDCTFARLPTNEKEMVHSKILFQSETLLFAGKVGCMRSRPVLPHMRLNQSCSL